MTHALQVLRHPAARTTSPNAWRETGGDKGPLQEHCANAAAGLPPTQPWTLALHVSGLQRLQLEGLRFPFPVAAQILRGHCEVAVPGQMLDPTGDRLIRALDYTSVSLKQEARIVFRSLRLQAPLSAAPGRHAKRQHKPVASALAATVFALPGHPWCVDNALQALRLDDGGSLTHRLLREGESFRELVATQRLMRLLFDRCAAAPNEGSAASYGFPDRCRLENALYDRFGIEPALLFRLLAKP